MKIKTVHVKGWLKHKVKRAEKQKTGIEKEKSESVPVFCCAKTSKTGVVIMIYKCPTDVPDTVAKLCYMAGTSIDSSRKSQ